MRTVSVMLVAGLFMLAPMALTPTGAQGDQTNQPSEAPASSGSAPADGAAPTTSQTDCNTQCREQQAKEERQRQECARRSNAGQTFAPDDPCYRYTQRYADAPQQTTGGNATNATTAADAHRESYIEQRNVRDPAERRAEQAALQQLKERQALLPEKLRAHAAGYIANDTGVYGRFVSFVPNAQVPALYEVTVAGTPLFASIVAPSPLNTSRAMIHGNTVQASGDGWALRMVDHPSASMKFTAHEAPFALTLPSGTSVQTLPSGLLLGYLTPDGHNLVGKLTGDITPSDDNVTFLVDGDARFLVSAKRVILEEVANKVRPDLERAMEAGRLGAEVSLLKGNNGVVNETTAFEDMDIEVQEGGVTADAPTTGVYTITIDSASHTGKTIVVNLEAGMLDVDNVVLRYFNVDENGTVEATIVRASSLEDVLDPENDGVVAEWWHVSSADGDAYLLSIPHFSVHQIQLQSVAKIIVEEPGIVLGVMGAIAVVALAGAGMMRRPKD